MRATLLATLALAACVASAHADPSRQIIVAFAASVPSSPERGPEVALAARAEVTPVASLADRVNGRAGTTTALVDQVGRPAPRSSSDVATSFDLSRVWLFEAPDSLAASRAIARLAQDPAVAWVEHNVRRQAMVWSMSRGIAPHATSAPPPLYDARAVQASSPSALVSSAFPNDPVFGDGRQWGLDNRGAWAPYGGVRGADVGAPAAWRTTTGDDRVMLAIADTGIDADHPDLGGPLASGAPRMAGAFNVVDGGSVRDLYGHGTPVAGVMAARTNNGAFQDSLGTAGVCGGDGASSAGCRIVPIKITPADGGLSSSFDIAAAILYATRVGARAVNLSFAGEHDSRLERLALHEAITHGCVTVAASGNRGFRDGTLSQYPAAYAALGLCIQVGASDARDQRAPFSSYGEGLDLLAPGLDIWTTFMTYPSARGGSHPGYVAASGTSFAAPFVTGAVGLLAAARPELDAADFQHILRESAHDLGTPGPDRETGWGRLDLAAALAAVGPGVGIWHDEVAADGIELVSIGTLHIGEGGFGAIERAGEFPATLYRVSATVTLPDSFIGPARLWVRPGGTTTVRGDFALPFFAPWAEVVEKSPRRFSLRGFVYALRTEDRGIAGVGSERFDANATYFPLPPDQMRFGFTVLGRVDRGDESVRNRSVSGPRAQGVGPHATPNPFTFETHISTPTGSALEIVDVRGRVIRRAPAGPFRFTWNGRDDDGRRVAPGIYFARIRGKNQSQAPSFRILKLE